MFVVIACVKNPSCRGSVFLTLLRWLQLRAEVMPGWCDISMTCVVFPCYSWQGGPVGNAMLLSGIVTQWWPLWATR